MRLSLKIAILIALVAVAAFSMGCAQKAQEGKVPTPANTPTSSTQTPKPVTSTNVTQLEKKINSTLENVNQLLEQLNDINNISFTV